MSQGALSDITVLDMTRVLSGPFAATWLGEMGANVIKIEIPNGGDESRRNPPSLPTAPVPSTPPSTATSAPLPWT